MDIYFIYSSSDFLYPIYVSGLLTEMLSETSEFILAFTVKVIFLATFTVKVIFLALSYPLGAFFSINVYVLPKTKFENSLLVPSVSHSYIKLPLSSIPSYKDNTAPVNGVLVS